MGPSAKRIRITGVSLLVVMGVAVYLAVTAINGVPLDPYKTIGATFSTASNLVPHDDVRINGARVGQVLAATYNDKTRQTTVKLQVQSGHPVYKDASAGVGDVSVLGAEYVDLSPGHKAAGSLTNGAITNTQTPVEIDDLLDIFGQKQADAASAAVQTLGQGFDGEGQNINTILQTAPALLPNLATTTQTLTDPAAALIPLIRQSNALSSSFQGRNQQLSQLLVNMNTTFAALDTQNGSALQSTINTAAPALPVVTPALQALGGAAGRTASAFQDLRPGLSALGGGTSDLRTFLRQVVTPLDKTPAVAKQAIPGVNGLSHTLDLIQTSYPVAPFLSRLAVQANPLLSYLAPYTIDMTNLWDTLANGLSGGDQYGNWLPFSVSSNSRSLTGGSPADIGPGVLQDERCAYPAPNTASELTTLKGSCK